MTDTPDPEPEVTPRPDNSGQESPDDVKQPDDPQTVASSDDDAADPDAQREGAKVINYIYGGIHSGSTTLGVAEGISVRSATGPLRAADVDKALRYYVAPRPNGATEPPVLAATRLLRNGRLVVLSGDEGIGRYTSALKLLKETSAPGTVPTALSPAVTVSELCRYSFTSGHGYLIADRLSENSHGPVQKFDVDRLARRLEEADAYLVITAETRTIDRRGFDGRIVAWQPPTPTDVLDRCLEVIPDIDLPTEDRDRVYEQAQELRLPREVVAFAERLPAGVDTAFGELDDVRRAKVRRWFEETSDWDELLVVAALAFLYAMPQRRFEVLHARLVAIDKEHGTDHGRSAEGTAGRMLRDRLRADAEDSLIRREMGEALDRDGFGREWLITFTSPGLHEHVLSQLYECGYGLWKPLRIWLDQLAADPDVRVRWRVALGAALLARTPTAAAEVELDFLNEWSCGFAFQRLTAAWTLTFMAGTDALAPAALRIALGWTRNQGERRAMTAAIALGSQLGMRYPSEAIKWLWHLSTRSQRIRAVAADSLALLFASHADNVDSAQSMLRRVLKRLRHTLRENPGPTKAAAAIRTVLTVLSAGHLDRGEPMVAHLLRARPEASSVVGEMLAEVLRTLTLHGEAIEVIRRTLEALADDPALVTRLGKAVRSGLSEPECALLRRTLERHLHVPPGQRDLYRSAISALLAALAGTGRNRGDLPRKVS